MLTLEKKHGSLIYGIWDFTAAIFNNNLSFRVNIEILGTLLRQGTAHNQFDYVTYIMDIVREENQKVNDVFLKHLEAFNDKCANILENKVGNLHCIM